MKNKYGAHIESNPRVAVAASNHLSVGLYWGMFVLDMPGEVIRSSESPSLTCGGVQTVWVGTYNPRPRCTLRVRHLAVADQVTFPGESLIA